MKYKIGDILKVVNNDSSKKHIGQIVRIIDVGSGKYPYELNVCPGLFWRAGELKLIERGGVPMKQPKFIVTYKNDDVEKFDTKKGAEVRIAELVEDGDAEDIMLFRVAEGWEIKTTKFELEEMKK